MANITKIRLSGTTYNIVDESAIHSLAGYATSAETQAAITAATNALAESIAEQGYQNASQVQTAIENGITGKADTTAVTAVNNALTAHTANTDIHVTVSDKTAWNAKLDAADITGLFGVVDYDSTAKRINFYNTSTGGTVLGYVDTTDFVKDGMVSNVEIKEVTGKGTCLVITFNTDSGKEAIEIQISQIFDASNYYTKSEVDTALAGKANTATTYSKTEVDGAINAATSGKVDTSTFTTYTGTTVPSLLGEKQDTLVSGTNIKTVNNESILGAGNINIVSTVDAELSTTSTNPVQNKVVKGALDGKNQVITLDSTTLVIS